MPKRQRDYRAEYQRRKRRAEEEGWKSYSQKRKAKERWESDEDLRRNWQLQGLYVYPDFSERDTAAWYRAFWDPTERQRRDRNSAKARYVVGVLGLMSYDEWEEKYGPK